MVMHEEKTDVVHSHSLRVIIRNWWMKDGKSTSARECKEQIDEVINDDTTIAIACFVDWYCIEKEVAPT
jgi:hypothetical protein